MPARAARAVTNEKLRLSRAPAAEIASAALDAAQAAGLENGKAAFIVVAVDPLELADVTDSVGSVLGPEANPQGPASGA